jgi:HAD superfamily phosphatase (TIGR01681 family)
VAKILHEDRRREEFAELQVREAPAVYGPRVFKCIVWDLDNTLWEGTLLRDGERGVRVRREVVEVIETTDRRGILHSIASANNFDEAMRALRRQGLDEYFLFPQINARAKSESIERIAERLRIDPGEMVFVDDEAVELEQVKAVFPRITVISAAECDGIPERPECMIPQNAATQHLREAIRERHLGATGLELPMPPGCEGFIHSMLDFHCKPGKRARRVRTARPHR